jgi:hypothetical protein
VSDSVTQTQNANERIGHSSILNKKVEGLENYKTLVSRPRPRPRPFRQDQDQDPRLSAQDQDQDFFQVLEAPRDQDHVLEDYSTVWK